MRRIFAPLVALIAVILTVTIAVEAQGSPEEPAGVEVASVAMEEQAEPSTTLPAPTTTTSTTTTTIDLGPPCEWNDQILAIDPACIAPTTTTAKPKPKPKPTAPPEPVVEQPPPPPPVPEPPAEPLQAPEPHEPPTGDQIWAHLARIRQCESGGNYSIVSKTGKFRGAYQFSRATWDSISRIAGRGDLVGVDPAAAAPGDQDAMAYALYVNSGPGQWPQCQYR